MSVKLVIVSSKRSVNSRSFQANVCGGHDLPSQEQQGRPTPKISKCVNRRAWKIRMSLKRTSRYSDRTSTWREDTDQNFEPTPC
ncbi:hypothetical protein RRG08_029348 [Elysia crispata]|uniref:Uncharacterized protein n=1 Tax=Elysia crispata TaxID=231223 RepID=A0AAE1AT18_9GAST|nr:hypothetical protein RRG08_029348 [Elysia crispata]